MERLIVMMLSLCFYKLLCVPGTSVLPFSNEGLCVVPSSDGPAVQFFGDVKCSAYGSLAERSAEKRGRVRICTADGSHGRQEGWAEQAGHTFLDGMADTPPLTSTTQEAAGMPIKYPGMKVEKLSELVMSTFLGKQDLKLEKSCSLWNPIFTYDVNRLVHRDCDSVVGHSSSTK